MSSLLLWSQIPIVAFSGMTHSFFDLIGTNGSSSAPLSGGDKENKSTDDDDKGEFELAS